MDLSFIQVQSILKVFLLLNRLDLRAGFQNKRDKA
jgi:hypothetical protein